MTDHIERLQAYLVSRRQLTGITSLTADASTREYFRIGWGDTTAIACVYPEPFDPADQNYLDVTRLFLAGGLPVAEIIDVDGGFGVIVQEDLGDTVLRDVLADSDESTRTQLLNEAILLIARIQVATPKAFKLNSVASRLKFDTEKLAWELNFFKTHYFETFLKRPLAERDEDGVTAEFNEIARELETRASVLCHRDFHAANLMIDPAGRLRLIDHQDARIGSASYDLVSLLLDRVIEAPSAEWLAEKCRYFLSVRRDMGLAAIDEADFAHEFKLQTIQRCLKATGTFSYQSVNRGKTYFVPFIQPMFRIAVRAIKSLERFPALNKILSEQVTDPLQTR